MVYLKRVKSYKKIWKEYKYNAIICTVLISRAASIFSFVARPNLIYLKCYSTSSFIIRHFYFLRLQNFNSFVCPWNDWIRISTDFSVEYHISTLYKLWIAKNFFENWRWRTNRVSSEPTFRKEIMIKNQNIAAIKLPYNSTTCKMIRDMN